MVNHMMCIHSIVNITALITVNFNPFVLVRIVYTLMLVICCAMMRLLFIKKNNVLLSI